jgi:hypothetical protein
MAQIIINKLVRVCSKGKIQEEMLNPNRYSIMPAKKPLSHPDMNAKRTLANVNAIS